jgi:hypothetical protein
MHIFDTHSVAQNNVCQMYHYSCPCGPTRPFVCGGAGTRIPQRPGFSRRAQYSYMSEYVSSTNASIISPALTRNPDDYRRQPIL